MFASDVAKIPFFYDVQGEDLDKLANILTVKEFKNEQVVFKEGDEQSGMYFILEGDVQILKRNNKGKQELLTVLCAPQIFGEMALIDRGRRSATVVAQSDLSTAELTRENFEQFMMDEPDLAVHIIRKIAHTLSLRLRKVSASYANVIN
ncbi:MAG: cyclic nucleotide-binding domain-containing protein [Cyanobacteriota bacterium]